jgi:uncharacterized protein YbjQ (UPF0145 family)
MPKWICPVCAASHNVTVQHLGKTAKCQKCGIANVVTDSESISCPDEPEVDSFSSDGEWYVLVNGVAEGPYTTSQIVIMLERKEIMSTHLVGRCADEVTQPIFAVAEICDELNLAAEFRKSTIASKRSAPGSVPVVTTDLIETPGFAVTRHLPVIFARRLFGFSVIAEFFVGFTDAGGGRSRTVESTIQRIEQELVSDLQSQARGMFAQAVVKASFQFGNLSGGNSIMLYGFAQGTPVLMRELQSPTHASTSE